MNNERITIKIQIRADGRTMRQFLRAALRGTHTSTDEACELFDAIERAHLGADSAITPDGAIVEAYADTGTIAGAARATGLARSTVRARLAKMSAAAHALDEELRTPANDNMSALTALREVQRRTG